MSYLEIELRKRYQAINMTCRALDKESDLNITQV